MSLTAVLSLVPMAVLLGVLVVDLHVDLSTAGLAHQVGYYKIMRSAKGVVALPVPLAILLGFGAVIKQAAGSGRHWADGASLLFGAFSIYGFIVQLLPAQNALMSGNMASADEAQRHIDHIRLWHLRLLPSSLASLALQAYRHMAVDANPVAALKRA